MTDDFFPVPKHKSSISPEEYRTMIQGKPRVKKYRNKKTRRSEDGQVALDSDRAGHRFDSGFEADVFSYLKMLERQGEVSNIERQVEVHLTKAKILYKPDFRIRDLVTGEVVYIEAKGFETPEWRIKRRLWMHYGPGKLRIYGRGGRYPWLKEEIIPFGS